MKVSLVFCKGLIVVKKRLQGMRPGIFLLACFFLLCTGVYWVVSRWVIHPDPVNVYVEMKVIDLAGHPSAGASIFSAKEALGVTDAFGEWSRFIKAPLGSTLQLSIHKQLADTVLTAVKEISVPLHVMNGEELRIRANVHLVEKDRKAKKL